MQRATVRSTELAPVGEGQHSPSAINERNARRSYRKRKGSQMDSAPTEADAKDPQTCPLSASLFRQPF